MTLGINALIASFRADRAHHERPRARGCLGETGLQPGQRPATLLPLLP
jgi:hypothetical protein